MKWKATVLVIAVFLIGVVLGGLGDRLLGDRVLANYRQTQLPTTKEEVLKQLTVECSLTPDQQKQIRAIMEDVMAESHRIYEPIRPQLEGVRQAGRQRMRGVLTPEQLPKFEAYVKHFDAERKKLEK